MSAPRLFGRTDRYLYFPLKRTPSVATHPGSAHPGAGFATLKNADHDRFERLTRRVEPTTRRRNEVCSEARP